MSELARTIFCGGSVGAALVMTVGSRRSTMDTALVLSIAAARVFSMEAPTCLMGAEPKPTSQARTQLARAVPARALIRRCALVANRHVSMIRPPKALHEPDYTAKHATALILRTTK